MLTDMTTEEIVAYIAAQNVVNAINEYVRVTVGSPILTIRKRGTRDCVTIDGFSVVKQDEYNLGNIIIF